MDYLKLKTNATYECLSTLQYDEIKDQMLHFKNKNKYIVQFAEPGIK